MNATRVLHLAVDGGIAAAPAGESPATRTVAIVPGTEVLTRVVSLPARTEAQARAAIPFLLAEEIGAPAKSQHLALGPRREGSEERLVAVVARQRMEAWTGALAAAGIVADRMIPDHGAVIAGHREAVLFDLPGHVAAALGDGTGCAIEHELLPDLLGPLLERAGVARVTLHSAAPDRLAPREGWGDREVVVASADAMAALAAGAGENAGPDLLQGAFGPRRDWPALVRPWRRVALLAAALPILFAVATLTDIRRLDSQRRAALAEAEALFREAVPEAGRVVNPKAQIDAALAAAEARSGSDFLAAADILFEALAGVEGAALSALRYDAGRGGLVAEIVHTGQEDLERIDRAASARGARVDKGSSRASAAGTVSELTLEARR